MIQLENDGLIVLWKKIKNKVHDAFDDEFGSSFNPKSFAELMDVIRNDLIVNIDKVTVKLAEILRRKVTKQIVKEYLRELPTIKRQTCIDQLIADGDIRSIWQDISTHVAAQFAAAFAPLTIANEEKFIASGIAISFDKDFYHDAKFAVTLPTIFNHLESSLDVAQRNPGMGMSSTP